MTKTSLLESPQFTATQGISTTLVYPLPGEIIYTSDYYTIFFSALNMPSDAVFELSFSPDGGATYTLITTEPSTCGGYGYGFGVPTSNAFLKLDVVQNGVVLASSETGPFSVVAGTGTVTVTKPVTAVTCAQGTKLPIRWTHNYGLVNRFNLEVSRDGGTSWEWNTINDLVEPDTSTTGALDWIVIGPVTNKARIRVEEYPGSARAETPTNFSIVAPVLKLLAPIKAVTWTIGTRQTIQWRHNLGLNVPIRIELSRNGGRTWRRIGEILPPPLLQPPQLNGGSYKWLVTGPATKHARIRISWNSAGYMAGDASKVDFVIA